MSGPIIRKYGFPNFEKIFGDPGMKHGVDDQPPPAPEPSKEGGGETAAKNEPTKTELPAGSDPKKG